MGVQALSVQFWVVVGLMVLAIALLGSFLASLYRKAGPHEALIVYGFRGTRIVKGHGTVIFPMIEAYHELSLELMSVDVAPAQDLYTKQGVAVTVEAVAQIKVKSDIQSIQTAAEQFLTKTPDQRESLIKLVMEGHLRGIIGQLTVEQLVKEPEMVAERMRGTCADDMNKMGLEGVSVRIQQIEREQQIKVQEAEITRREKELIATVLKQVEMERQRISVLAEAEKSRLTIEAEGTAAAVRMRGEAEADIIFKKGDAEARAMNVKAEAF